MARYQDQFKLDVNDIEIIERALRQEIARQSSKSEAATASELQRHQAQILNRVLGKIHSQKVFYAQVHASDVPAG